MFTETGVVVLKQPQIELPYLPTSDRFRKRSLVVPGSYPVHRLASFLTGVGTRYLPNTYLVLYNNGQHLIVKAVED